MKRMYLSILVLLVSLLHYSNLQAKGVKEGFTYVYSYFAPVSINNVETNDTATIVRFIWDTGNNTCWMEIPELVYLIDSSGKKYNLKSMEGISKGKHVREKKKKITFSMAFDPLPEDNVLFDIESGYTFDRIFCFYGIHRSKVRKLEYKNYLPRHDENYNNAEYLKVGDVHIRGTVAGGIQSNLTARVYCISNDTGYNQYKGISTLIDSLGHFELTIPAIGPRWTYLHIEDPQNAIPENPEIPVFLTPDDTLQCIVKNYKRYDQNCEIISLTGKDLHANLLSADPKGPYCPQLVNQTARLGLKKAKRRIVEELGRIGELNQYLAWKYHLTKEELSLLNLNIEIRMETIWNHLVCGVNNGKNYGFPPKILDDVRWKSCPESEGLQITLDRWKDQISSRFKEDE